MIHLVTDQTTDELPQIRENLKQGFLQTQSKVNKWITDFQKRIDGDDEEAPVAGASSSGQQRQNFGASQSEQLYGIQRNAEAYNARRSTDRERYDADPQVLSDNFEGLEMRDEGRLSRQQFQSRAIAADRQAEAPPPKPARPSTNPNLFKPTPPPPQSGPVDEVDALYSKPSLSSTTGPNRQPSPSSGKSKKWQPLTSIAPNPDADDNDPFALGDSDDDREAAKKTDIRADATERLKNAASSADGATSTTGKRLSETETTAGGTRNKEADDILSKDGS